MDYTSRYGLEFNPFLKNSKDILVETQEFKELRFRLDYLLSTRGFGLLTGSPGRGKTTAIRSWAQSLNPSLYKVVYSSLSTLTVMEFYRNLATELGIQPATGKQKTSVISRTRSTALSWKNASLPSSSLMRPTIFPAPSSMT